MSVKNVARFVILWVALMVFSSVHAEDSISPAGNWTVVNSDTKEPQALVKIWEDENHFLLGKIIKVYDPRKNKTMCQSCPEDFKNKPLVGMQILWGLRQATAYTWNDGSILSPRRGKVFPCNLTITQDGQTVTIRIYGGMMALLGKTETWYRAA